MGGTDTTHLAGDRHQIYFKDVQARRRLGKPIK